METATTPSTSRVLHYCVGFFTSRNSIQCRPRACSSRGNRRPFSWRNAGPTTSLYLSPLRITLSTCQVMRAACRGGGPDFTADEYGPYPWDPSWQSSDNEGLEWYQEDIVTLFTTEGLIQIGGTLIPHQPSSTERKQSRGRVPVKYRRFKEEDYMDPKQGLCLGAVFDIVATNGLDMGRRLCVFGFCRSIEMLSEVVEDTVVEQGGEVVIAAKGTRGGLNEKLSMKVAVPLLWGVPPAVDSLNYAIRCGGGIVEKVSRQWEFL
ncbi:hypothetical protein GOP47_0020769 [Adiantum capillus-veneris]|uniref:DUF7811 domain-containing protein n=1 Tax=Adiantum capillus-veneris TaxID=13818 RepID=A0A9D4U9S4_ADICA|nr:hypothetical protein GOP47_0020769 [Adiantum capillus-veneris]